MARDPQLEKALADAQAAYESCKAAADVAYETMRAAYFDYWEDRGNADKYDKWTRAKDNFSRLMDRKDKASARLSKVEQMVRDNRIS